VIIEAVNDIIECAIKKDHLKNRVSKEYRYFDNAEKDEVCNIYRSITYQQLFSNQLPWFIEKSLKEIAKIEKRSFSVLIISPTRTQIKTISNKLISKGFQNIQFVDKNQSKDPLLIDGLNILLKNNQNNLGWRIASKFFLNEKDFKVLIKSTNDNLNCKIVNLISKTCKSEIEILLKIVRTISKNKKIDNTDLDKLFNLIDINPYTLAKDMVGDQLELVDQKKVNSGLRKIPIKTTTVQSSKGLSADYVFITHFDNQYFIKDKNKTKISDQDICSLLVALTRAKKKVFLISSNTKIEPTFLKWIKSERVEKNSHDHL
jgi:hypothetical protein